MKHGISATLQVNEKMAIQSWEYKRLFHCETYRELVGGGGEGFPGTKWSEQSGVTTQLSYETTYMCSCIKVNTAETQVLSFFCTFSHSYTVHVGIPLLQLNLNEMDLILLSTSDSKVLKSTREEWGIRELQKTMTATAMGTSLNKNLKEQSNGCACAL